MSKLRQRFIDRTALDLAVLEGAKNDRDPEVISIVHRLAGTAGMLGYTELSAIAGRLDDLLAQNGPDAAAAIQDLLVTLRRTTAPH